MRKKEREITDRDELIAILEEADVCRIAIHDEPAPYIVTMNFGYETGGETALFFHCAVEGRKLDLLAGNDTVGFEMDVGHELVRGEKPCQWSMKYRSIVGTGRVAEILGEKAKKAALDRIMDHYGFGEREKTYDDAALQRTKILKLTVGEMTGKRRG
jgi:nitroimidazol reductase NimA-like FMN-containing flavoprotein (pyridoxamine 5'-phosphate oxidase superfamily)